MEGETELARLLVRAMYRLALAGLDVNARDSSGQTALVLAASLGNKNDGQPDQTLITYLLRIGQYL